MNVIKRVIEQVDANIILQSKGEDGDVFRDFFNKVASMNQYAYRNQKMVISIDWPKEFEKINTNNVSFLEESWLFYQVILNLDSFLAEAISDPRALGEIRKKLDKFVYDESRYCCGKFDEFVDEVKKTVTYDYYLTIGEKLPEEPKISVINVEPSLRKIAEIVGVKQMIVAIMVPDKINDYERVMIADYLGYRFRRVCFWIGNLKPGLLTTSNKQFVEYIHDYELLSL